MPKPSRYGIEDISADQLARWETKYGENWADEVEPETRTQSWDAATKAELKRLLASEDRDAPSGYFGRVFERKNIRECWDPTDDDAQEPGWAYVVVELDTEKL